MVGLVCDDSITSVEDAVQIGAVLSTVTEVVALLCASTRWIVVSPILKIKTNIKTRIPIKEVYTVILPAVCI